MTGPEMFLTWCICTALFFGTAWIVRRLERRKEEQELARNMEEHRIRCNRCSIIADMERGEW